MVVNSLILCEREHSRIFSSLTKDGVADTALMSKLFSSCTGYEISEQELNKSGERIWNQLRAIDVRKFGRNRAIDESTLNSFIYPSKDDGITLDPEKFLRLLDKYYELSGWDIHTGYPSGKKLYELNLGDVAKEIW